MSWKAPLRLPPALLVLQPPYPTPAGNSVEVNFIVTIIIRNQLCGVWSVLPSVMEGQRKRFNNEIKDAVSLCRCVATCIRHTIKKVWVEHRVREVTSLFNNI